MEMEEEGYHSIVFISTATAELEEAALLRLLGQARQLHQQADITGVLLYSDGRFLQVIEGRPSVVRRVFDLIAADPRHGRLELLANGPLTQREFAGWHMGFAPPPAGNYQQLPNYLTPPQLVMTGLGSPTQLVLSEFLASSAKTIFI